MALGARLRLKRSAAKQRAELSDAYVANSLGMPVSSCPADLIVLKREQIRLSRLSKLLRQEISNQLENANGN